MGERLRINAQLIDAADGRHIWAERYDGNMAEIFEFQDRIREEIVAALELRLTPSDEVRSKKRRTSSVEAYDCYLSGRNHYYRYSAAALEKAFESLKMAVELDPDFAEAHAYLSACYLSIHVFRWIDAEGGLKEALEVATKSVNLAPESAVAQSRLAWVHTWRGDWAEAERCFQKAITLEPDLAEPYLYYAVMKVRDGDPGGALEITETALEQDPYLPPADYHFGMEHLFLGQVDRAIEYLERARSKMPHQTGGRLHLTVAYAAAGRYEDARAEVADIARISPGYNMKTVEEIYLFRRSRDRDFFLGNPRKAGLPEGDAAALKASPLALPDKPSIAVLPFDNLSGDPEQEYFSDGITEDIITALSRIRQFFVIARNTTFTYKGQALDVQAIAKDLGVRYVLEGSVRKSGGRVRISAQLIDGATGNHLWAERYDRELEDVFAVQDEITLNVVGAIGPELSRAEQERARRKPPENLDAWDFYQRGLWHLWRYEKDETAEAKRLLQRAIETDPNLAPAFAALAWAHVHEFALGFTDDPTAAIEGIMKYAEQALKLDEREAFGYTMRGAGYLFRRDHAAAQNDLNTALKFDPSNAFARMILGMSYNWCNQPDDAIPHFDEAERLSPKDPNLWLALMGRTVSHLIEGRFEEANEAGRRAVTIPNATLVAHFIPTDVIHDTLAHFRRVMEASRSGMVRRSFQAMHSRRRRWRRSRRRRGARDSSCAGIPRCSRSGSARAHRAAGRRE